MSGSRRERPQQRNTLDPALNFLSPQFDPLLALESPGVRAPIPSAKPRDTVDKCRPLLPPDDPNYTRGAIIKPKAPKQWLPDGPRLLDRFSTLFKVPKPMTLGKGQRGPPSKMKEGPLSMLPKLFAKKCRIRVWIRRDRGIRGYCEGYLRAFDKHFNMVLQDVQETYTKILARRTQASLLKSLHKKAPLPLPPHISSFPPDLRPPLLLGAGAGMMPPVGETKVAAPLSSVAFSGGSTAPLGSRSMSPALAWRQPDSALAWRQPDSVSALPSGIVPMPLSRQPSPETRNASSASKFKTPDAISGAPVPKKSRFAPPTNQKPIRKDSAQRRRHKNHKKNSRRSRHQPSSWELYESAPQVRHMNQLFVRGDGVLMVCEAPR